MRMHDALRMVLENRFNGYVVYKGRFNSECHRYTDFKYGKSERSKRYMARRNEELAEYNTDFIIVRLLEGDESSDQYLIITKNGDVTYESKILVGDMVSLNLTGNYTAEWRCSGCNSMKQKIKTNKHKFKDLSGRKAKREFFKNMTPEQLDLLSTCKNSEVSLNILENIKKLVP